MNNEKIQNEIDNLGIYESLIEVAFNAHKKAADALIGDSSSPFECEKWQKIEREILIVADYVFNNQ